MVPKATIEALKCHQNALIVLELSPVTHEGTNFIINAGLNLKSEQNQLDKFNNGYQVWIAINASLYLFLCVRKSKFEFDYTRYGMMLAFLSYAVYIDIVNYREKKKKRISPKMWIRCLALICSLCM